jgi:hypothetical protein
VLLQDKLALVSKIEAKDDLARHLEAGLHQLAHQLECALSDRSALLQQLAVFSPKFQEGMAGSEDGGGSSELLPTLSEVPSEGEELLGQALGLGPSLSLGPEQQQQQQQQ